MTREDAQRQRRAPSGAERDAWVALATLREGGIHMRRQHPIGRYVADIAIAKARVAIEIDGPFHEWPENLQHEEARKAYIENMGWRIVRIKASDARNADLVRTTVQQALPPSPRGEGAGGRGESQPLKLKSPRVERRTRANRVLPSRVHD